MSTKTFDNALNFMPTTKRHAGWGHNVFKTIATVFKAISDGFAASCEYETMTARGVPHDRAVKVVLAKHFN